MTRSASYPSAVRRIVVVVGLAAGTSAAAQPFEAVYGGAMSSETAGNRVVPVVYCLGGGFIVAGTSTSALGASDAYVARVTANGARIWEFLYDLGASESGVSLVELRNGTGFVVAGTTDTGGNRDLFLIKLNCAGGVAWAYTYASLDGRHETAADLVQARTGDPLAGTHSGDLVVAGTTRAADGTDSDGFLLRTRVNGTPVWDRRYRVDSLRHTSFAGLGETRRRADGVTGDIVAVGAAHDAMPPYHGYAVRVDGNTGAFTHFDQCAAAYTVDLLDSGVGFASVIELTTRPHRGQLVMAGTSASITPPVAMVLRTAANPCVPLATRGFSSAVAPGVMLTFGRGIVEARSNLGLASAGQVLLAASVLRSGPPPLPFSAALLSVLEPSTLAPVPGHSATYGRHAGVSALAIHTSGIVLAGQSADDPEGIGDPGDIFLVDTDTLGLTGCSGALEPPSEPWPLRELAFTPSVTSFLASTAHAVTRRGQKTGFVSCP